MQYAAHLESVVQHVSRSRNGKDHEEEDEEAGLPIVGTDMLCGIQDGAHQPACTTMRAGHDLALS